MELDIIDGQVHGNRIGPNWRTVPLHETLNALVVAMDAVGVSGVVIDEAIGQDDNFNTLPGRMEDDGFWRPTRPFSELAVSLYPDRFRYLWRMNRLDPRLDELMADFFSAPGRAAIRVYNSGPRSAIWTDQAFLDGEYNRLFELAEQHQIPIFILTSGRPETVEPYARRFPGLQFVIDHIGVAWPGVDEPEPSRYARLDAVIALADCPNIALKWSHIERLAAQPYPYSDAMPYVRKVVDAFGANRIMWGSDCTQTLLQDMGHYPPTITRHLSSWSELLHYLLDSELFSSDEKQQILGGTARALLRWPAPS